MKLECGKLSKRNATPELVQEVVRDISKSGEYMILMHDDDNEAFVQVACDFNEVGGEDDGCLSLEYREGVHSHLFLCKQRVPVDEIEEILLDELDGRTEWRKRYEWEPVEGFEPLPSTRGGRFSFGGKWLLLIPALLALAYVMHGAILWKQYGPPTGFCMKCLFYWGKHEVDTADRHLVERKPLQWSWSPSKDR